MKSRLPWIVWLLILLLGFTGPVQALNAVVPDLSKIGQTKCTAKIEHGSFPINFSDPSGTDPVPVNGKLRPNLGGGSGGTFTGSQGDKNIGSLSAAGFTLASRPEGTVVSAIVTIQNLMSSNLDVLWTVTATATGCSNGKIVNGVGSINGKSVNLQGKPDVFQASPVISSDAYPIGTTVIEVTILALFYTQPSYLQQMRGISAFDPALSVGWGEVVYDISIDPSSPFYNAP